MTWLLLVHQLPPKPDYLRVKVGRRLQRIGALPVKSTVYILPSTPSTREDLEWTLREIRESGGEGQLFEATAVAGVTDGELQQRFHAAREAAYAPLVKRARALARRTRKRGDFAGALEKLRQEVESVRAVDFFDAPAGQTVTALLDQMQRDVFGTGDVAAHDYRGRTWVTRTGVQIDRIASAWLIRRFIDAAATFRFAASKGELADDEVGFDMFDAEFTHEGELCTFEVLLQRFRLGDRALRAIGEVVHDIDLKEARYGRPEAAGTAAILHGIALAHRDDAERLRLGGEILEGLYAVYRKTR
ncbi:MAG TPA: chromate resistance protein ChrB domain-containing protein [Thermoanaerobaculia bacterium]|nr:chromate resistance protein ChrB domain-containing protein [Thermoanaerobaculia bacterium]